MPTATSSPTAVPIEQQILIEYNIGSGDGTPPQLFFLGVAMPEFVLYMDGRLLVNIVENSMKDSESNWYLEARLTPSEMCALLDAVENTGFFDVTGGGGYSYEQEDPIYEFGDFQNFSDGAPYATFIVNGPIPKSVHIYTPYWDFVTEEVKAMRALLDQFSTRATERYQPEQLMLWVEEGVPEWFELVIASQPWPDDLPELSQLAAQQAQAEGYGGFLINDGFEPLLELLDYRMKYGLFVEAGKEYLVVARQLLPHELPDEFPATNRDAQMLPLPFDCAP